MAQSLAKIYVHFVYSTKNRTPFLTSPNIRKELYAYLATAFKGYESPAVLIGGTEDHVHVLCVLSRNSTVAKVGGEVKRNSSKWLKTKGGNLAKFQWQSGYGAFSVSHSNVARVRQYISGQEEHHRKRTFQEEFRAMLRKHEIEFDERYVWD